MAFFDDFVSAVNSYPSSHVTLSIINVALQTGTPGPVNVNEIWKFQVRVNNSGPLNLTGLLLHVEGQNGALVSEDAIQFSPSLITDAPMQVNGQSQAVSAPLFFKAPDNLKPAGTALVRAHISTYDADLNRILITNTGHADPPAGIHAAQVHP